ncbi:MAG: hypothetical protein IJN53_06195, partial [Oscillospiraceae bacterium]|nr:hypothetical protein [Oscillospiraceae bacterium]
FSTDCQRSRKPQRQANRTRRRTGGTVEGGLRSKSKCLAKQAFSLHFKQMLYFKIASILKIAPNCQKLHFDGLGLYRHSVPPLMRGLKSSVIA